MDLDTYLRENAISGIEFAALLGVTEASLSRIRRGNQNISRDMIRRIFDLTSGEVSLGALVFPLDHESHPATSAASPSPDKAPDNIVLLGVER